MIPTAVMFSGGAGTSIGAQQAGAEIVWAANHKQACVDVHRANFPMCDTVCQDLHLFNHAAMAEHDMLLASPVCRAHSPAGRGAKKKAADERRAKGKPEAASLAARHNAMRALVWSVIDALEVNRPRYFVIENVEEFSDWVFYRDCLRMIRKLGYKVSTQVLDSLAWGVPQSRIRLFVIGTLGPKPIRVRDPRVFTPTPMHSFVDWEGGDWIPISENPWPKARAQLERANVDFGGAPSFVSLVSHRPVWPSTESLRTMTTQDQIRWVRDGHYKYPTAEEGFALMGFPKDYVLTPAMKAHRTIAWAMAGDAVCPPVMRGIVSKIRDSE